MAERVVRGSRTSEGKAALAHAFRREPTLAENTLWQALRGGKFGGLRFCRQQIIEGFVADFYCRAAGLVVEIDGPIHDDQRENDAYRSLVFAARGISVFRVTNDEVLADISRTLTRIYAASEGEVAPLSSECPRGEPPVFSPSRSP